MFDVAVLQQGRLVERVCGLNLCAASLKAQELAKKQKKAAKGSCEQVFTPQDKGELSGGYIVRNASGTIHSEVVVVDPTVWQSYPTK